MHQEKTIVKTTVIGRTETMTRMMRIGTRTTTMETEEEVILETATDIIRETDTGTTQVTTTTEEVTETTPEAVTEVLQEDDTIAEAIVPDIDNLEAQVTEGTTTTTTTMEMDTTGTMRGDQAENEQQRLEDWSTRKTTMMKFLQNAQTAKRCTS